jgi:hypothetical protein
MITHPFKWKDEVFRKEKHHEDCNVDEWCAVRLFGWGPGYGMGMVAKGGFLR